MPSSYAPFQHLSQHVWKATKRAHITLTILGTLLLAPAALVIAIFWSQLQSPYGRLANPDEFLILGSAMTGSISGGFAWCTLCLLFFKRSDLRWQRIAWRTCAAFGYLTIPCSLGWLIWMSSENTPLEFNLIMIAILATAISCAVLGTRYARLARIPHRAPATQELEG